MATSDWTSFQLDVVRRQLVNQSDDPRVGSGRDNATGGTITHVTSSGSNSASWSTLGGTFVPVAVYSVVCLSLFLFLRPRCLRVYAARTIPGLLLPHELSPRLPSGWFNWIKPLLQTSDAFILNHCSLDGFFFLRYLKVVGIICFVGLCLTWPVLLPIHGTGRAGVEQLDMLTIGNIVQVSRFYAHAVIAYCFFGFILFMISRECIYYINLRQAYLLSPYHAERLSSRTVLFTSVPQALLDERKIRKLFGDSVRNVWIPRDTKALASVVKEREQTAMRLEKAEITLIKKANAARRKIVGNEASIATHHEAGLVSAAASAEGTVSITSIVKRVGEPDVNETARSSSSSTGYSLGLEEEREKVEDPEYVHPYGLDPSLPDVRGSVAAQWIPVEARPTHRPLANYGRQVDTIKWTRLRLKLLSSKIYKLRRELRGGSGRPISAAFVEFDSLASAQAGYQILAHHRPLHMTPGYVGIKPDQVIWSSLRMPWWERIMRRFLFMGAITAAIIFWSIPSAFVGMVSNIQFLSKNVPFLKWVIELPGAITGVIEGLLPALALSWLMAAVPGMLRACGRASGVPSLPLIELFTQGWYFVFQVVQVFLVTTLTSAVSGALMSILKDPMSAKDLLAQNLPKASNFYLSYILVQCLAGGATELLRGYDLFRHQVIAKSIQNPRGRYKIWRGLKSRHWGALFPVFTNMGVIAICYSCIAPLILLFASLGMGFIYFVYKYNMIYSYDSDVDTHGLLYPHALLHLIVGLYMAEICLVGLFGLHTAFGPLILMILFMVFTIMVHVSLNDALGPLLNNLPRTLALQDQSLADEGLPGEVISNGNSSGDADVNQGGSAAEYYNMEEGCGMEETNAQPPTAGAAADYYNTEEDFSMEPTLDRTGAYLKPEVQPPITTTSNTRAVEGAGGLVSTLGTFASTIFMSEVNNSLPTDSESRLTVFLHHVMNWITPDPTKKPNFLIKWLHPEVFDDYYVLKQMLPTEPPPDNCPDHIAKRGYYPPEMWMPPPRLWIPKDEARVSRQEVAHSRESVAISDQGAWLDEKGRIVCEVEKAPFREERVLY